MKANIRDADKNHMQLALKLAARGQGWVEPNPMVGAIIVRNKTIVGRGWHRQGRRADCRRQGSTNNGV